MSRNIDTNFKLFIEDNSLNLTPLKNNLLLLSKNQEYRITILKKIIKKAKETYLSEEVFVVFNPSSLDVFFSEINDRLKFFRLLDSNNLEDYNSTDSTFKKLPYIFIIFDFSSCQLNSDNLDEIYEIILEANKVGISFCFLMDNNDLLSFNFRNSFYYSIKINSLKKLILIENNIETIIEL